MVAGVTIFRIFAAAYMPLREGEMYYWVWSRHLAYGYADHPPFLAWLIALTSFLGKSPLAIRSAFIVCWGIAALAVGRAALELGATAIGASMAAIIFALIPQPDSLAAIAGPDPAYVMFWALALVFAARAARHGRPSDFVSLGLALAGAMLSRFFGWALAAGVVAWACTPDSGLLRKRLWISAVLAGALYAPFIYWNATHQWMNFAFTFVARQGFSQPTASHFQSVQSIRFLVFAALFIPVTFALARSGAKTLLAWTALPLVFVFVVLAFFQNIESYWLLGPFTSLCVALGPWLIARTTLWRKALVALWTAAAAYTMAIIVYAVLTSGGPLYERYFAFVPLAARVQGLSVPAAAMPIADNWVVAATLEFNGVSVKMFGSGPQVQQWQQWYGSRLPQRALFVSDRPLSEDYAGLHTLKVAYARVTPGPALDFMPSATSRATFYTAWCLDGSQDRTRQPRP